MAVESEQRWCRFPFFPLTARPRRTPAVHVWAGFGCPPRDFVEDDFFTQAAPCPLSDQRPGLPLPQEILGRNAPQFLRLPAARRGP